MGMVNGHIMVQMVATESIFTQQIIDQGTRLQNVIPYSLKFLRDKIFADFAGQGMAAKIFSREISSS